MGLCHFHHGKKFCEDVLSLLFQNTHRKNAASAAVKYKPIVYALLEFPCAAIAWQTTSMMLKRILKVVAS